MIKIGTWSRGSDGVITVKVPKWSTKGGVEWIAVYGGAGSSHQFELRDVEIDLLTAFGDHVKLIRETQVSGILVELN
jgi:hypothetical protein